MFFRQSQTPAASSQQMASASDQSCWSQRYGDLRCNGGGHKDQVSFSFYYHPKATGRLVIKTDFFRDDIPLGTWRRRKRGGRGTTHTGTRPTQEQPLQTWDSFPAYFLVFPADENMGILPHWKKSVDFSELDLSPHWPSDLPGNPNRALPYFEAVERLAAKYGDQYRSYSADMESYKSEEKSECPSYMTNGWDQLHRLLEAIQSFTEDLWSDYKAARTNAGSVLAPPDGAEDPCPERWKARLDKRQIICANTVLKAEQAKDIEIRKCMRHIELQSSSLPIEREEWKREDERWEQMRNDILQASDDYTGESLSDHQKIESEWPSIWKKVSLNAWDNEDDWVVL